MNLFSVNMFSEVLQTNVEVNIAMPSVECMKKCGKKPAVLYLLHGLYGSSQSWIINSNVLRYNKENNLAIVMPDMNNTFFVNNSAGIKYLDFCAYELLEFVEKTFNVSDKREDNFVCGLSMGGYGAYRIALERPEKFFAAFSLSGALDVVSISDEKNLNAWDEAVVDSFKLNFGKDGAKRGSKDDLFYLLKNLSEKEAKPKLFQYCGRQDYLYLVNIAFKNYIEKLQFDYSYLESEGEHNWDFWDEKICDVLEKIKEMSNII